MIGNDDVKRKYVILPLILVCFILAGCSAKSDDSKTLTVNADFSNDNTSKLFSHKVTVADENGRIYYLSNEILGDEELNLWWHGDRLSDDEWNE